jgi:hypothetical protein
VVVSSVFSWEIYGLWNLWFLKSKWWLEDFGMMMLMVVVVVMIMTRVQICAYIRILGDVPFNFCCTFADFLFVMMIFGNCRFW